MHMAIEGWPWWFNSVWGAMAPTAKGVKAGSDRNMRKHTGHHFLLNKQLHRSRTVRLPLMTPVSRQHRTHVSVDSWTAFSFTPPCWLSTFLTTWQQEALWKASVMLGCILLWKLDHHYCRLYPYHSLTAVAPFSRIMHFSTKFDLWSPRKIHLFHFLYRACFIILASTEIKQVHLHSGMLTPQ